MPGSLPDLSDTDYTSPCCPSTAPLDAGLKHSSAGSIPRGNTHRPWIEHQLIVVNACVTWSALQVLLRQQRRLRICTQTAPPDSVRPSQTSRPSRCIDHLSKGIHSIPLLRCCATHPGRHQSLAVLVVSSHLRSRERG